MLIVRLLLPAGFLPDGFEELPDVLKDDEGRSETCDDDDEEDDYEENEEDHYRYHDDEERSKTRPGVIFLDQLVHLPLPNLDRSG